MVSIMYTYLFSDKLKGDVPSYIERARTTVIRRFSDSADENAGKSTICGFWFHSAKKLVQSKSTHTISAQKSVSARRLLGLDRFT